MSKKSAKRFKKAGYPINFIGGGSKGIAKLIRKRIKIRRSVDTPFILGHTPLTTAPKHLNQLRSAFERGGLVGILDASPGDITALYASVGLEIEAEPDMPDVEFFGLKREPDGIRQITCYAPAQVYLLSEERAHINADGSVKISEVEIGTERIYPSKSWSKARALALIEQIGEIHHNILLPDMCVAGEENNIMSLAEAFKDQRMYPIGVLDFKKRTLTNYFQISSFAYACYSENDHSDWYYVYQIGQFSPSNGFFSNGRRQRLWYADNYKMNAWPTDFPRNDLVSLIQSSPNTTTGARTATSSVSYSISGSVSYSDKGGQGSVSGGMSISNSLSISIPDLSVYNKSVDQINNAHWEFVIPKATGKDDGCLNDLNPVVAIAHNTFQPQNQWIWRADANTRGKGKAFRISSSFAVELVNTYIGRCNIFGCNCDVNHQKYNPYPEGAVSTFSVPFPPKARKEP
ncbi:MAG: leukocidin family pore-forming toxin [Gammaproteobacteria bacterium]|nr:leukocidin family pore-forming toxin [Gammaproteobacteria bacterium]